MSKDKYDNNFLKKTLNLKKIREEQQGAVAGHGLFKRSKKKVLTTAIGALHAIEQELGFLWGWEPLAEGDKKPSTAHLSPEQLELREIYEKIRAEILDNGNTQILLMSEDFNDYDINRKKHRINLPVRKLGEKKDGNK